MTLQTITIELPESTYRIASQIAKLTKRSMTEILKESLDRTLPPLEDVPLEDAVELAQMSLLSDASLWQIGDSAMSKGEQSQLSRLLALQKQEQLTSEQERSLQLLLDQYGKLLTRKAHAWLLLARRGYQVPPQRHSTQPHSEASQ